MSAIHVFFFRGMSTSGSDNARFTFLDFGPMCRHLQQAFDRREVQFHPVTGMGKGTIAEMAARARVFLENHPVWRDPHQRVHILGHSAGGLIARHLLMEPGIPKEKVLGFLTVATPHLGAKLADVCIGLPDNYPGSNFALRLAGFNMRLHKSFFEVFTGEAVTRVFNDKTVADIAAARVASVVCAAPRNEWCLPLRLFYILRAFNDFDDYTDGMIERDTQPFGEVLGELKIDHWRQAGFFGEHHRFQQLCDVLHGFFVTTQCQF